MNVQLKFENKNNFNILLIKPNKIDNLDWHDNNYTDNIIQLDIYENLICNSENFIEILTDKILLNKYKDKKNLEITTQLVAELPDYIYEILYIEELTKDNDKDNDKLTINDNKLTIVDNEFNNIGTLLNTNSMDLYGNVLLMKTYIPTLSNSIIINDCFKDDIKIILNRRINTNIVIYDDEWTELTVKGNLVDFANDFFDDTYCKLEIPFLLHNINIWYETCDGCATTTCGKILTKPIYKCIWFTMITDEYRGNINLFEVSKIIKISNVLDFPFTPKKEWIEDKIDEYGRKIIKNKYKILDQAYNELII